MQLSETQHNTLCDYVTWMANLSITVEHTYGVCPKYSELGSFCIIAYLYVSDGTHRWQRQSTEKKVQRFYI